MTTTLEAIITEFVSRVETGDLKWEATEIDVKELCELGEQAYILAVPLGIERCFPQPRDLRPSLEGFVDQPLPPVQFESKFNLPGDWEIRTKNSTSESPTPQFDRVFLPCPSRRWFQDMSTLSKVVATQGHSNPVPPAPSESECPTPSTSLTVRSVRTKSEDAIVSNVREQLTMNEHRVLQELLRAKPRLLRNADLAAGVDLAVSTCKSIIASLIRRGFVDRPCGERNGRASCN